MAAEQDRPDVAQRRAEWRVAQVGLDPDRLVFIDETWAKTINLVRLTAWLAHERHHPTPPPSHGDHRDRTGVRARETPGKLCRIGKVSPV